MSRKRVTDKEIIVSATTPTRRKPATVRVKRPALTPADAPETQVVTNAVTREQVAKLAFLYWEARGCQGGSPEEDWLRAEQELAAKPLTAGATA